MGEDFFEYESSKIHFIKFGDGEKLLIALHGFGDRASSFLALKTALQKEYTVYAIDLPFHGQTQWQGDSFSQKDILGWFKIILDREKKQRYNLMGFSLGGRIILALLSRVLKDVDKIYMIAPDGLKTNGMSIASLAPIWLRRFLKAQAFNPNILIKIVKGGYQIGLVSKFNFHFVQYNLLAEERQDRIFNTWIALNNFEVKLEEVRLLLMEIAIPIELYFGKHDKIIPLTAGQKFADGMPNVHLSIINEGHLLLNEKLDKLIGKQIN